MVHVLTEASSGCCTPAAVEGGMGVRERTRQRRSVGADSSPLQWRVLDAIASWVIVTDDSASCGADTAVSRTFGGYKFQRRLVCKQARAASSLQNMPPDP